MPTKFLNISTDGTLAGNSDSTVVSEKAIKTYVASQIPDTSSFATTTQLADKADKTNKINGIPLSTVSGYFYGTSSTAAATTTKEVSIPSITALNTGQVIVVQPSVTSTASASSLKLNSFTAYPMLYNNAALNTDTDGMVWSSAFPSFWVFDGSNWRFAGRGVDSNTTYSMNYLNDQGLCKVGGTSSDTQAISRYSLVMQLPDGTWQKITKTTEAYSTGTSKHVNTNGFLLPTIKYYNTTTIVAGGGTVGNRTFSPYRESIDLRYSTNCGDTPGWTNGDYIYIVGTIGADGLFYLDTTTWWANALPSSNDSKYYVRLGVVTDVYKASLQLEHPVFYHNGTKICQYVAADNKQDVISDLSTIRSGAAAGATALQPNTAASTYLKLAGGTMTGAIKFATGSLTQNQTPQYYLAMDAFASGGEVKWTSVANARSGKDGDGNTISSTYVKASTKGAANGVASLDANTKIPAAQLPTMVGAGASTAGTAGAVPAPVAGANELFLRGDGTWADPGSGGGGTGPSRNVGEMVESLVPLTDAGLHLLDGTVINSGSYAAFVSYIAGLSVSTPSLFVTESAWQQSITDFGVCSKFVYDSTNNTVRLPKIYNDERYLVDTYSDGTAWYNVYSDGWCEQGNISEVASAGATVNLVKPFVDTNYIITAAGTQSSYGNISAYSKTTSTFGGWTSDDSSFNASSMQWVAYGYVDTTNLKLNNLYRYIVIANSTKTEIEVDIDEVATDLNAKVDKADLSEVQCVVETYHNGTEWYRIYSDGWCEQGGFVQGTSNYRKVITFLQEFANANYSVYFGAQYTTSASATPLVETSTKTSAGFTMISADNSNYSTYWEAKGYI